MRLGIDIRSLQSPVRTGIGEYVAGLLSALFTLDKSNEYLLFSNSSKPFAIPSNWQQVNVRHIHTRYPNKYFNASLALSGLPKLDSLLTKNTQNLDYFYSPHFNFTALSRSVKHIITVHDLTFSLFPHFLTLRAQWWHWAVAPRRQCRQAEHIFTPSENTKRDIVDYYNVPADKISVLYPGLPKPTHNAIPEQIKQKYALPEKYILFLGTIEPRKNIVALIKGYELAFSKLTDRPTLVIAGAAGWKNSDVAKAILTSPVRQHIRELNYIEPGDKAAVYAGASLFVYPSIYEGFGFPVLEAMQAGVPVITSNRSSLPEITDGAAYLVNPHRPDEIADGITLLAQSNILRERYRALGFEQSKKFSWQKTAEQFLHYFTK